MTTRDKANNISSDTPDWQKLNKNLETWFKEVFVVRDEIADIKEQLAEINKTLVSLLSIYAELRVFEQKFFKKPPSF